MSIKNPSQSSSSLGYKVYAALISQAGIADPVVTVLGTNTIGAIVWTRTSAGLYFGTLAGAFVANKTGLVPGSVNQGITNQDSISNLTFERASVNQVRIQSARVTGLNGVDPAFIDLGDDLINEFFIEIRVYP